MKDKVQNRQGMKQECRLLFISTNNDRIMRVVMRLRELLRYQFLVALYDDLLPVAPNDVLKIEISERRWKWNNFSQRI